MCLNSFNYLLCLLPADIYVALITTSTPNLPLANPELHMHILHNILQGLSCKWDFGPYILHFRNPCTAIMFSSIQLTCLFYIQHSSEDYSGLGKE